MCQQRAADGEWVLLWCKPPQHCPGLVQGGLLPKGAKGMRAGELWDTQVLWEMQVTLSSWRAGPSSQLDGASAAPPTFGNAGTSQHLLPLALTAGNCSD